MIKKTKTFSAHKNLLFDVMTRQAGTTGKAIVEGIMNSLDANAKRVDITINREGFSITDDGRGIQTEKELDDNFGVLGQPHTPGQDGEIQTTYGEFRMGRGQIFAQGVTTWETGSFRLIVDLKEKGLDYEQHILESPLQGCKIQTQLYNPLSVESILSTCSEVRQACAFTDNEVFLNGEIINTPAHTQKWDQEDETARYKLKPASDHSQGIKIYQRGILVETIPGYSTGVSGKIVSKKRFRLNFARNQIMRSCPNWKTIQAVISTYSQKERKEKKTLSKQEKLFTILELCTRNVGRVDKKIPLFEDIQGKTWSRQNLEKPRGYTRLPDGRAILSFAPKGAAKADKIMQQKGAVILDESILEFLQESGVQIKEDTFIETVFGDYIYKHYLQYTPLNEIVKELQESYALVPPNEETAREKLMVQALERIGAELSYQEYPQESYRRIRIGKSLATAWTDSKNYIAFEQEFIKDHQKGTISDCATIISILIHEYCHQERDDTGHSHSAQFYQDFERISTHLGGKLTQMLFEAYGKKLEEEKIRQDRRVLKQKIYQENHSKENQKNQIDLSL